MIENKSFGERYESSGDESWVQYESKGEWGWQLGEQLSMLFVHKLFPLPKEWNTGKMPYEYQKNAS